MQHILDLRQRRRRVQHHPGNLPQVANLGKGAVQMDRRPGLAMDQQVIGAGLGEILEIMFGLDHHQVDIDRFCRRLAHRGDHHRADREVGNEPPIHHIDMDPVGAGAVDRAHLVGQAPEIGRQDRRGDDDGAGHGRAPAIVTGSAGATAGRCATAGCRRHRGRRRRQGRVRAAPSCPRSTNRGSAAPPPSRPRRRPPG